VVLRSGALHPREAMEIAAVAPLPDLHANVPPLDAVTEDRTPRQPDALSIVGSEFVIFFSFIFLMILNLTFFYLRFDK
jgi:hypothetical protein